MKNVLIFNGISSADYGISVDCAGTFAIPESRVETEVIPGRNGEFITRDEGLFENVKLQYTGHIEKGFRARYQEYMAAIASSRGYNRLEDSAHPDAYRMGYFASEVIPKTGVFNESGKFQLTFNCRPERWLKSGEIARIFTSNGRIVNPTPFKARPIIRAYGSGTVAIAGKSISVSASNGYTDLYCEEEDARKGTENRNLYVSGAYPVLPPGENEVRISGFSKVEIIPRWWTI